MFALPLLMQVEPIDLSLEELKSAETKELERGGYDCKFVEEPPAGLQTECTICLQILREPHMISCCSHRFCRSCIESIKVDGKSCPLCKATDFDLMRDRGLERSLKHLNVHCTHAASGCEWTGELRLLSEHLHMNPKSEKLMEGCGFIEVKCIHCGHHFQRSVLINHLIEECPKWPYAVYKGMHHYHVSNPC